TTDNGSHIFIALTVPQFITKGCAHNATSHCSGVGAAARVAIGVGFVVTVFLRHLTGNALIHRAHLYHLGISRMATVARTGMSGGGEQRGNSKTNRPACSA